MEWLSQNWIWLALGLGAIFMMSRGGRGGCCGGGGHEGGGKRRETEGLPPKETMSSGAGHEH